MNSFCRIKMAVKPYLLECLTLVASDGYLEYKRSFSMTTVNYGLLITFPCWFNGAGEYCKVTAEARFEYTEMNDFFAVIHLIYVFISLFVLQCIRGDNGYEYHYKPCLALLSPLFWDHIETLLTCVIIIFKLYKPIYNFWKIVLFKLFDDNLNDSIL